MPVQDFFDKQPASGVLSPILQQQVLTMLNWKVIEKDAPKQSEVLKKDNFVLRMEMVDDGRRDKYLVIKLFEEESFEVYGLKIDMGYLQHKKYENTFDDPETVFDVLKNNIRDIKVSSQGQIKYDLTYPNTKRRIRTCLFQTQKRGQDLKDEPLKQLVQKQEQKIRELEEAQKRYLESIQEYEQLQSALNQRQRPYASCFEQPKRLDNSNEDSCMRINQSAYHPHSSHFVVSQGGKRVVFKNGDGSWYNFAHFEPLKKDQKHSFKFRIIRTTVKAIMVGVCDYSMRNEKEVCFKHNSVTLLLRNGNINAYEKTVDNVGAVDVMPGRTIIELVVDLVKQELRWRVDDELLYEMSLSQQLRRVELCPIILMGQKDSEIEFVR